jgi:alanine racemase
VIVVTSFYRPTWVEVDLDAVTSNVKAFRNALPDLVRLMAVVKANAYGHGALKVAETALSAGASSLGVAFLDEALQLRRAGFTCPILIMGYTDPAGYSLAIEHRLDLTFYDPDSLKKLGEKANELKQSATIHIKVDTGMGRLGLIDEQELIDMVEYIKNHPFLEWRGLFTHYACADEPDKENTFQQSDRFKQMMEALDKEGFKPPQVHAGNSATGIDIPDLAFDMVRLGISLYGLYPSNDVSRDKIVLQPVLSWNTKIVQLKQVPEGTPISYGSTYRTKGIERIATLPVGYADGYTRLLAGKGEVIVKGHRVPVVGRICMDQMMINVTDVPEAELGDEVVLIGCQGNETVSAEEMAEWVGTINYEIPCKIGLRVPRIYLQNGTVVHTDNYIEGIYP